MPDERWLLRQSMRLYAALLWLYPARFRRESGSEMKATFRCWLADEVRGHRFLGLVRVWQVIASELLPTIAREYWECAAERVTALAGSERLWLTLRALAAGLLPVGGYLFLLGKTVGAHDVAVLSVWFAFTAAPIAWARGRGWECIQGAVIGSMSAVGLIVTASALTETTTPGILRLAPLLTAVAVTFALIVATYVRVVMEGVTWPDRAFN